MDEKQLLQTIEQAARDGRTGLNLSLKFIESLPPQIGQLTNLTELDLSGNPLTSVPKELGQLTNLEVLDLGGNQLTSVPKELGQLTNLTELDLRNNQLTSVPKELGQLTNLTKLDLGGNPLTSVPKGLGQLTNLTVLGVYGTEEATAPPLQEVEQVNVLINLADDIRYEEVTDLLRALNSLHSSVAGFAPYLNEIQIGQHTKEHAAWEETY